jgi:hypothetical protein
MNNIQLGHYYIIRDGSLKVTALGQLLYCQGRIGYRDYEIYYFRILAADTPYVPHWYTPEEMLKEIPEDMLCIEAAKLKYMIGEEEDYEYL